MLADLPKSRGPDQSRSRDLLHQWRDLTQLEREAILARAFDNLKEYQGQKRSLQKKLAMLYPAPDDSHNPEVSSFEQDETLQGLVSELIRLETINHEILASAIQEVRHEISSIDSCQRRIKRFLPTPTAQAEIGWKTYG